MNVGPLKVLNEATEIPTDEDDTLVDAKENTVVWALMRPAE
jgi:hypothetical protein